MILEIDAQGWVLIIGAVASAATVICAAVVGVIIAWQNGKKLDVAAERREELAGMVMPPASGTHTPAPPVP